ncbi:protein serine/threonine phosphatase [Mycosarcoma maydis]|uniref:RNA polymerase II subunit A C-terminal domain phosphatase n=1 Tax=Mycosarcoma maydis TaxID=5270 RepID=A0A0D1ED52_MYCMD|nr:protein serine/threonine phosphatase [Ustilago maydis 521]KIS72150.1 hypothetical protein UMAG_00568 [Ustilago maydis 521]|eukprot:XP_011386398.1 hypothetical protein UMAG_00568 [Ustilago maydis 521]
MSQTQEPCKHPVQLFGMCAVCGQPVDADSEESASLSVMHSSSAVKVSAEEAQRLDSETTSHLLSQRKLALIVDLDQTVIHATVDPTVGEWMRDESNPNYEALQSVGKFRLGIDGEEIKDEEDGSEPKDPAAALKASRACWYYVKPRPGVPQVLKHLSEKYELHVYTMGTRSYANCVCKLIDPDASIFGNRILSRDENGSLVRKSLSRLFPVDHSMVVIIDDREDVWSRSPNLLPVLPYEFFVGIGDINATFLPTPPPSPGALPEVIASGAANKANDAPTVAALSTSGSEARSSNDGTDATTPERAVEEAAQKAEAEGRSEDELQALREAAAHFVAQTEKLQSKLAEQREARPLARMQEALDEKLGRHSNGASRSGTATPNGNSDEHNGQTSEADSSGSDSETGAGDHNRADAATAAAGMLEDMAASVNNSTGATSRLSSGTGLPPLLPPPPPLPPHRSHAVLVDDDNELDRVQSILDDLHAQWYAKYDFMQSATDAAASNAAMLKPSVVDLIGMKKAQVLKGCTIVFSSMIPFGHNVEKSDLWAMAREFGATPASEIEVGVTTHVVAARPGTAKVHQALRLSGQLEVVWPSWFHVSASRWSRQDEALYRISEGENALASANAKAEAQVANQRVQDQTSSLAANEEAQAQVAELTREDPDESLFENELNDMDWGAAADEVDAYLDSATTASNTSSPSPSMHDDDEQVDVHHTNAPLQGDSRKRLRPDDVPSTDLANSQTSKKQRPQSDAGDNNNDDDDDDADDGFLDHLAEELDGQIDNE